MEIEETKYLSYADAVFIHIRLMRICGEIHFGVFDRALIESALTRPQQSAAYENSDIIRQAATSLLWINQKSSMGGRQQANSHSYR